MWIGITVIILMGIFPPWLSVHHGGVYGAGGYRFILTKSGGYPHASRLCLQWAMVGFITGGLIVTLKDEKPKDEPNNK